MSRGWRRLAPCAVLTSTTTIEHLCAACENAPGHLIGKASRRVCAAPDGGLPAFGDGGAGMTCGGGGFHVAPADRTAVTGTGTAVAAATTFGDGGSGVAHRGGSSYIPAGHGASASGHDGVLLCVEGYFIGPAIRGCGTGHSGGGAAGWVTPKGVASQPF